MQGNVQVYLQDEIIVAEYIGQIDSELLKEGQRKIRAFLNGDSCCILHDTSEMEPVDMSLAQQMKEFKKEIQPYIHKTATFTQDSSTAFKARIAFEHAADHKVFYEDKDSAIKWLKN